MRDRKEFDPTPLSWVRADLDALFSSIVASLETGGDAAVYAAARDAAHQAAGVLRMLNLEGAAVAAGALDTALAAAADGRLALDADGGGALRNLAEGLMRWLKRLSQGGEGSALELFPLYERARKLAGEEHVFEGDLFFPDLRHRPPAPAAPDAGQVGEIARRARAHFQRGLLAFLRGQNSDTALAPMREALALIESCAPSPAAHTFWWAARGLIDALIAHDVGADFHVKQLLARIDLQLRRLIEGSPRVAERLLRDTLYFIARSHAATGRAAEVRALFELDRELVVTALPDPDTLARLRPALAALAEGVQAAQSLWQHDNAAAALVARIEPLIPQARQLPHSGLAELLTTMGEAARSQAGAAEERTLEIAGALLFLAQAIAREDILTDRFAPTAAHLRERLAALALGLPAPGEPIAAGADARDREVVAALAREISANLRQIELLLDGFFRDSGKRPEGLAGLARDTAGAMRMLELDAAAHLLDTVSAHMARYSEAGEPGEIERQQIADALSGLGVYLEAAADRRDDPAMLRPMLIDWGLAEAEADDGALNDTIEAGLPARRDAVRDSYLAWREIGDPGFRQFYLDRLAELAGDAELIDDHDLLGTCRALVARHRGAEQVGVEDDAEVARLVGELPPRETAAPAPAVEAAVPLEAPASPEPVVPPEPEAVAGGALVFESIAVPPPATPPEAAPDHAFGLEFEAIAPAAPAAPPEPPATAPGLTFEHYAPAPEAVEIPAPTASEALEFRTDLPTPAEELPFQFPPAPVWEAIIEIARPAWHAVVEIAQPQWHALVETARPVWHALIETAAPPAPGVEAIEPMPAPPGVEAATPEAATPGLPEDTTDAELVGIFLEEADEALGQLSGAIADCRERPADRDALTDVRRVFHTLKGSGRMVGLNALGEVAWRFEALLNDWQAAERDATPALLDACTAGAALFRDWVARLSGEGGLPDALTATLTGLDQVAAGAAWPGAAATETAALEPATPEPTAPTIAAPEAIATETIAPAPAVEPAAAEVAPQPPGATEDDTLEIGGVSVPRALYELFVAEARDRIAVAIDEVVRQRVAVVPVDDPSLRAIHTLAGIAATTGFAELSALARALEHYWQRFVGEPPPVATLDLVETVVLHLQGMVEDLAAGFPASAAPELIAALEELEPAGQTLPAVQAVESVPVDLPPPALALPVVERRHIQDELDPLVLPIFIEEADTLVPETSAQLRAWHETPTDEQPRDALRRSLHTLKGSARMAGAMRLGELLHIMENRVVEAIEQRAPLTPEVFDSLFGEFDRMVDALEKLRGHEPEEAPEQAAVEEAAPQATATRDTAARDATALTIRVRADWVDRMVNLAGEVAIARSRIESDMAAIKRQIGELSEAVVRLKSHVREVEIQAESQMQSTLMASADHRKFDPLEFDRFTRFQEVTRFLAESVNDIATVQHVLLARLGEADVALLNQSRLNRELQQDLLHVRMVPLNSVSERLYRTVRLGARDVGRRVHLDIQGGEIEIDRSVLDRIVAPIEHLLRNSLAHGIEPPEARVAAGKPETGEILLAARQSGNEMHLSVKDDGSGLDFARIRDKAERLGILAPGKDVPEARLTQLIFAPGFSTAQQVTSVAGRGVGMDVVKSEIAALGGRIDVRSKSGQGIDFEIALPLTLAMMQAVIADSGGESYAVPATLVRQMMELKPQALAAALAAGELVWRDERFPLVYLPHLLGQRDARPELDNALPVLLVDSGDARVAVLADAVSNAREIVLKPVGPQLARLPGVAGATVRGDGRVMLILNPATLAQRHFAAPPEPVAPVEAQAVAPRVLVVDDSLTVRKITSRLLAREGYRVDTAKDGVDALEKMREATPDIVLLDVEMPRMDGFELARAMKGDATLATVPIIMITSRTADKHRQHAAEIGVEVYLGKPYQEQELLAHIAGRVGPGLPT